MAESAVTPRFLSDVYQGASECNKCSLCQAVCPTYVVNPVEWETARGRVSLVRDAIEGKLELADIEDGPLSTCLTCDCCVAACAPAVPTATIVSRARQELNAQRGHPFGQTIAMRAIFPRPLVLRFLHGFSRFTQVTGLHEAVRRTGVTRWLGTPGHLAEHLGPVPRYSAYRRARDLPSAQEPIRGRLAFLVCCYQNAAVPEATEASMKVLLNEGYELVVPQLGCSGLPARTLGDRDAELDMAVRTVERLRDLDVDGFVGDVASCTGQWRNYRNLVGDDPLVGEDARRIGSRTWLLSRFFSHVGLRSLLGPLHWKVAIDEPCSLPLTPEDREASRKLLQSIPRLTITPFEEAAMCCGGPGLYFAQQPERSEAILARKFDKVIQSGADVLVTENVSCITQLRAGARRYAPHVRVMHLFEVIDASIERGKRRAAVIPQ
ncbi:MAG TPA: (Fe-S)-binding protein [Candidatus Sulfotelmatobacter sp.]|nr:(Fe-S)-binding protein [Candidatus Sulfotelmatobacter sp.]